MAAKITRNRERRLGEKKADRQKGKLLGYLLLCIAFPLAIGSIINIDRTPAELAPPIVAAVLTLSGLVLIWRGRYAALCHRKPQEKCDLCGGDGPSRPLIFQQNIGLLVTRRSSSTEGCLCSSCARKLFLRCTLKTAAVGWIGLISIFVAPYIVVENAVNYVDSLGTD